MFVELDDLTDAQLSARYRMVAAICHEDSRESRRGQRIGGDIAREMLDNQETLQRLRREMIDRHLPLPER